MPDPGMGVGFLIEEDADVAFHDAGSVPHFLSPSSEVMGYIERRADEVGCPIKSNRGVPPKGVKSSMLSPAEKAVAILGRALGVTPKDVILRINSERAERGEEPRSDLTGNTLNKLCLEYYRPVVDAVRMDMVEAVEAMSPLAVAQNRYVWRAQIVEFYRREMTAVAKHSGPIMEDGTLRVRSHVVAKIDRAMRPHLKYFDGLDKARGGPLAGLRSSSERAAEAGGEATQAEALVQEMFESGKISDSERIGLLRKLRHGDGDDEDDEGE